MIVGAMMVQFETDDGNFIYRAAAIVLRGDEVLLHTFGDHAFWVLPGGRIELGESGAECVRRELIEELEMNVDFRVGRLVWIIENFYTQRGQRNHECGLYFEAFLPEDSPLVGTETYIGHEWDGSELLFRWFPVATLPEVNLLPAVLRTGLQQLPAGTEYVIHRDGGE